MGALDGKIIMSTCEMRPCWVNGRRAIFHRWTDSARPVKPRSRDEETDERLQKWSVHGIVEYEDGTVDREWPSAIRFADSMGHFAEWDWEGMECARDFMDDCQIRKNCSTCAHLEDNVDICNRDDCAKCAVECYCKDCCDFNKWEPEEGAV